VQVLSIILLVILFLLFKQIKKLNKAKQDIDLANIQSELNKELYVLMKIKRNPILPWPKPTC
jgi:hypothetical protein